MVQRPGKWDTHFQQDAQSFLVFEAGSHYVPPYLAILKDARELSSLTGEGQAAAEAARKDQNPGAQTSVGVTEDWLDWLRTEQVEDSEFGGTWPKCLSGCGVEIRLGK